MSNKKIKNTIFYHGNENKSHNFSELVPSFFSSDYNYALGYGKNVKPYRIKTKKAFDTSSDNYALDYYNNVFKKDELGKHAKELKKGECISFLDADNFWAFVTVESELGKIHDYDSIIVKEHSIGYKTDTSIVPFKISQIEKLNEIDLDITNKSRLSDKECDLFFELKELHEHGNCHALSMVISDKVGDLKLLTTKDGSVLHSFVELENGLCVDAGGLLSPLNILSRYESCVSDFSDFIIKDIERKELLILSGVDDKDMMMAKKYLTLAKKHNNKFYFKKNNKNKNNMI